MAKEEKIDLGRDPFDSDDNWNSDIGNPPTVQDGRNDRNPVRRAGKTVLREMGKTTFSRNMAKQIIKSAMPGSFSVTLDNADRALVDSRAMMSDIKKEAAPAVRDMRALGRTLNRLIPTSYSKKIDQLLKEKDTGPNAKAMAMDWENLAVARDLSEVFGNEDTREEKTEKLAEKLTELQYRQKMGSVALSIRDLLAKQTAYQFSVQRSYQRKTLELNIRQLMISRAQLDTTQKAAVETSNLLRSIVENTGLPDVVKQHRSEEFLKSVRENMYGKAQKRLGEWTSTYRENISKRFRESAKKHFSAFSNGASLANSSLEQLEQQRELLESMGINPADFMAGTLGNNAALMMGRRLGKFVGRRAPRLGRTDGFWQGANFLFNNKERLAADWARRGGRRNGLLSPFTDTLRDTLRLDYRDKGTVRSGGLAGLESGALDIEKRKLRAIEEIIPGYLSRMLHSIDMLRTGNNSVERTVYNHQKGTFTSFSESVKDTGDTLLRDGDIERQRKTIERLVESIDSEKKLSDAAKANIVDSLLSRSRTSKSFNPNSLIKEPITGLNETDGHLWKVLLVKRYGMSLNKQNEWAVNPFSEKNRNLNLDAGQYNYASNQTSALFNRAKGLSETGNLDQLIADGAVVFKNGNWELNTEYYDQRSRGIRGNGPTPPVPPNGNGPGPSPGPLPPLPPIPPNPADPGSGGGGRGRRGRRGRNGRDSGPFDFDRLSDIISGQIDRVLNSMSTKQAYLETILPEILGRIGSGGGSGGSGEGGPVPPGPGDRRRRRGILNRLISGARSGTRGLWNIGGIPFRAAGDILKRIRRPAWNAAMTIGTFGLNKVFGFGMQAFEQAQDGYVQGASGLEKVIEKSGLQDGRYIDQRTNKTIKKLSDIRGAVWDVVGNTQVVTEDQARGGIYTADGKKVKTSFNRVAGALGSLVTGRFTPYGLLRSGLGLGRGIMGSLLNRLPDIYVVGEMTPRLYASKLAKGEYYSLLTGRPIKKLTEMAGGVGEIDPLTRQMKPVLTAEDAARGLIDKNGKPIRTGLSRLLGTAGGLLRGAGSLAMAPLRMLNSMGRAASNLVTGGFRAVGGFVGRGFGLSRGGDGSGSPWVKRIYRLLVNKFTGKDPLEGLEEEEGGGGRSVLSWLRRGGKNAKDATLRLKDRAGSWWNRLREEKHGPPVPKGFRRVLPNGGGWSKMLWLAVGGVSAVLGKIYGGMKSFFGWIKDLPKWLNAGKLLSGAGDLLGRGGKLGRGVKALGRGAKFLGGAALTAGRFALAGIGSLFSLPGLAIAAAVVGAGYLIYKGYQAYSNRINDLREYRGAQYGVDVKNKDQVGKVMALEEAVLKESTMTVQGKLKMGSLDYPGLMSAFEINAADDRAVLRWTRWFRMRFIPVFTRNVETLYSMDKKAKLTDATFLKSGERPSFARRTFIPSVSPDSPYRVSDSPFVTESSIIGDGYVESYRDKVIKNYENDEKKLGLKKPEVAPVQKPQTTAEVVNSKINDIRQDKPRNVDPSTDLYYSPGDRVDIPGGITGDAQRDELIQIGNRIDDLTAVRMKLYGLTQLVKDDVNTLITLETDVANNVRIVEGGAARFTASSDAFFTKWAGSFTVNVNDGNQKTAWVTWFEKRFLPVYLNFYSESTRISPNISPSLAWKKLNSSDLLRIANFANSAKTSIGTQEMSVWNVRAFPWPKRYAGTDSSIINVNLDNLRLQSKKEVYEEKVRSQAEIDKMTYDGKKLKDTAVGSKIKDLMGDMSAVTAGSKGRAGRGNATGIYGAGMASMGTSYESAGSSYDYSADNLLHTGTGTGGSINDLPASRGDGWENNRDLIAAVAKMTGVDPGSLAAMIAQESGFEVNAKAGTSSARGLGQFLNGTWKEIMPTLVEKYGVNPNTLQNDARASVLATAEYMKKNAKIIGDIGRPLTTTDIYMAHFLGPGGARKVLSVPSNTPIQQAMGDSYDKVAKANPDIFKQVRTTGDLSRVMSGYLSKNGGRYVDEANSLAGSLGSDSPAATPETPPLPTPSTPSTPSTAATPAPGSNFSAAKGELPQSTSETAAAFSRGTDTVTVTPPVRADNRIELAKAQTAAAAQSDAKSTATEKRQEVVETAVKEKNDEGSVLSKSLAVQREMRDKLGEIFNHLTKSVTAQDNGKANPDQARLMGDVPKSPNLQGNRSKGTFDSRLSADHFR